MRSALLVLFVILFPGFQRVFAQSTPVNRGNYRLQVIRTESPITVDGVLDEKIWSQAEKTSPFYRILPIDTGYAHSQSEVMVVYDETNIYMGIICHDTLPGKRPAESLRRDFSFARNDNFIAFIDTYNDQTNGFAFGISAAGAQWDGLQANGGFVSLDWDCKWKSAVTNYPEYWVAEFSIPFRSIRYREGDSEWGINFSRLDLKTNEKSSWAPVPRQFQSANLAYTGTLAWDNPLPSSGVRFSMIPYVSGKATHQKEAGEAIVFAGGAGLDAKVILSSSMNLDVTVNPDYSQVEVDQQRTNLDRFELYFPEKRKFFLENSDLFASLGTDNIRPFFSRRIGLDAPVLAGARLSGNAGKNWRVGLMNMQTGTKDSILANNFSVAVLQRKILSRSNVGVFMTNKQALGVSGDSSYNSYLYNRVAGADFNFANANNNWTGKAFYHHSFNPGPGGDRFSTAAMILYETQQFSAGWNQVFVGGNYMAEMGFVRRKGYHQTNPTIGYRFYPLSKRVANHGPDVTVDLFFEPDFSLTDREIELSYSLEWMNRSTISLDLEEGYVKLIEPFDPTNTGGVMLPAGSEFQWTEVALTYNSDVRRLFNFEASGRYGGFFNGTRLSLTSEINYRVQPYGSLSLVTSYNRILLPEPYTSVDLILVGPRLDLTFTRNLFFTTFVQYNNQIDNLNVNMRFQWRFAPVSDLFIVYTENAYPTGLRTKDRGIVVKLSYWIN
ncbi:MAG: carbohydrate binding family 9 domain-containing protein [Bacteroidales bacterium]|nr:carbohydrate binding family 9 domain-containing protein [Bacteroidales bacterium]